jgi:hypothetical protein
MTKYVIESDKIGTVGDEFIPAEGINVEALLEGGFISTAGETKSHKVKPEAPKE